MRKIEVMELAHGAACMAGAMCLLRQDDPDRAMFDVPDHVLPEVFRPDLWYMPDFGEPFEVEPFLEMLFDYTIARRYPPEALYRQSCEWRGVMPQNWPDLPQENRRAFHVWNFISCGMAHEIVPDPIPEPVPAPNNPARGFDKSDPDDDLSGKVGEGRLETLTGKGEGDAQQGPAPAGVDGTEPAPEGTEAEQADTDQPDGDPKTVQQPQGEPEPPVVSPEPGVHETAGQSDGESDIAKTDDAAVTAASTEPASPNSDAKTKTRRRRTKTKA